MSTIKTLLEKQAQAVKANADKIKQAEALEKQAAALRAEANKPAMINFKAYAQAKRERLEKFSDAMRRGRERDIENLLTRFNWVQSFKGPESSCYGLKEAPGYRIEIKNGKFSLHYHKEEKQAPIELYNLEAFLSSFKKQLK